MKDSLKKSEDTVAMKGPEEGSMTWFVASDGGIKTPSVDADNVVSVHKDTVAVHFHINGDVENATPRQRETLVDVLSVIRQRLGFDDKN